MSNNKKECLDKKFEEPEDRYYIAPRNEWVNWPNYFAFFRGKGDYKSGTPVERLRQAAFDTRRTGVAQFHFGELMGYEPDVKLMVEAMAEDEQYDFEEKMNDLRLEIHKYEANDGHIMPKLAIKESDKVAKLFEQMADLVEPFWKRVEANYN